MTTMATASAEHAHAVRVLLFTVASQPFAIEVSHTREVVVFEEWTTVPGAPGHLVGMANLRGYVIPILTIQDLLGLPSGPAGHRLRALVIAQPSGLVAIVIEGTLGLETCNEVIPCGPSVRREYGDCALGIVKWDGQMVPLLDVPKVSAALRMGLQRTC